MTDDVFDSLSKLEQLKRTNNPLKKRVAEVLYRDKYELITSEMKDDWKHLDVPRRNQKETKEYEESSFFDDISNNTLR